MQLSILVLTTDGAGAPALATALGAGGGNVRVVPTIEEFVAAAYGHGMLVIDRVPDDATLAGVIDAVRGDPAAATIPILAVAPTSELEDRIALLEAGADDVIPRPFDPRSVAAQLEAVGIQFGQLTPSDRPGGAAGARRVITVFSPKGGVGSTTIVVNVGVVAAEANPGRTLVVDLDLSFGQVSSHLNLQPKQTLVDLIRDPVALEEAELFRSYVIHHGSGIDVLAAPPVPGYAGFVTGEHVERIVARALETYDVVVIDGGATIGDRLMALMSLSDIVIVPVQPEIPSLNAVRVTLDQLEETGAVGGTTVFVLNNTFAKELLKRGDIETALGAAIAAELPYDAEAYLKAANEGEPLVRGSAKSLAAKRLRELAASVLVGSPTPARAETRPAAPARKGIFGGLRR